MAYAYNTSNLTNLGQLKKLAQRTKSELDALDSRVDALEEAGYQTASDVQSAINAKIASTYKAGGSKTAAEITAGTLNVEANEGVVYNLSDALTLTSATKSLFVEGAENSYPAGTNIVVVAVTANDTTTYKFDALSGFVDLSDYATKVSGGTNGNFAALDSNGNLVDSGHKHSDYLTAHQDISGKADKDTDAVEGNFAAFDANGNPVDSGTKASDFLTAHQDISGKMDLVSSPTANNFVKQNASGQLVDAGYALASDQNVEDMIHDVWGDPDTIGT